MAAVLLDSNTNCTSCHWSLISGAPDSGTSWSDVRGNPKVQTLSHPVTVREVFLNIFYCKRVGRDADLSLRRTAVTSVSTLRGLQSEVHSVWETVQKTQSERGELVALSHTICLPHFYQPSTLIHSVTALSGSISPRFHKDVIADLSPSHHASVHHYITRLSPLTVNWRRCLSVAEINCGC